MIWRAGGMHCGSTNAARAREHGGARTGAWRMHLTLRVPRDDAAPPPGSARARPRLLGSRDPHDCRAAAASSAGLRATRRQARWQDPHPQLWTWRRRHVALVGHGGDGGRHGAGPQRTPRRRHRLRRRRADIGPAAAAPRLRRHHLRRHGPARHHVQHVAGRLHAHLRPVCERAAHARVGRAVPAGRAHRLPAAPAPGRGRSTGSRGSTTIHRSRRRPRGGAAIR